MRVRFALQRQKRTDVLFERTCMRTAPFSGMMEFKCGMSKQGGGFQTRDPSSVCRSHGGMSFRRMSHSEKSDSKSGPSQICIFRQRDCVLQSVPVR